MHQGLKPDRIPVAGPWITQREIDYVNDAVRNAWYRNSNLYHERFEAAFAGYVGRRYAMALPSCTSALHLSLLAAGVGTGHEVVVPEISWIASSAPINYVGAVPVFADVDADTWCLSARSFEAAITPRTKAVIVVDLYGGIPDMDAILRIAAEHGIAVIEDSAEAIGSEYRGRKAGSFGLLSTFSFHGSKTLTTGEGGMLLTDDEQVFRRCSFLRDHGRAPGSKMFWNTEVAHKYKMSSMQAALGLAQVERMPELLARKREIFSWYREALAHVDGIVLNTEPEVVLNSYWMVTVLVDRDAGIAKETLLAEMSARGVDCRPFFYPLSSLPAYEGLPQAVQARRNNPVAYDLSPRGINLPSGFNLTQDLVARVASELKQVLASARAHSVGG